MADQKSINNIFTQHGGICPMASYATAIEYFSKGRINIEDVLSSYIEKFEIWLTFPDVHCIEKKHEIINEHFKKYCAPDDIRGFEFIKMLHEKNYLDTGKYCKIKYFKASKEEIDNNDKDLIRNFLVNHDALAIVTFKVRVNGVVQIGNYHAVMMGFNPKENHYFYKDPNKPNCEVGDILFQELITEYIVFNEAVKSDRIFHINEDYLNENKTQLLNDAELNYFYGKEVFFTTGFNQNESILFQMLGNLGAYVNDYEFDDSINVVVLSDSLHNQMKNGFKNELLKKVEKKLNSKKNLKKKLLPTDEKKPIPITEKNPLVITKSSLIDFVKKRTSYYGDEFTQDLINSL